MCAGRYALLRTQLVDLAADCRVCGGGSQVSKFEYVSVAIALLYSLGLARLLGGPPRQHPRSRVVDRSDLDSRNDPYRLRWMVGYVEIQ